MDGYSLVGGMDALLRECSSSCLLFYYSEWMEGGWECNAVMGNKWKERRASFVMKLMLPGNLDESHFTQLHIGRLPFSF